MTFTPRYVCEVEILCPIGYYCPVGTNTQVPCASGKQLSMVYFECGDGCPAWPSAIPWYCAHAGTYNDKPGRHTPCNLTCDTAPGYGCTSGSSTVNGSECVPGSYGTGGSAPCVLCPANTFGNASGLTVRELEQIHLGAWVCVCLCVSLFVYMRLLKYVVCSQTPACSGHCGVNQFSHPGATTCTNCTELLCVSASVTVSATTTATFSTSDTTSSSDSASSTATLSISWSGKLCFVPSPPLPAASRSWWMNVVACLGSITDAFTNTIRVGIKIFEHQLVRHARRRPVDLIKQLRMGMQVLPPAGNVGVQVSDAVDDRHR